MATVAIIYYSQQGHTKLQAEAVTAGVASVSGVDVILYTASEATERIDELDAVDAMIFGSPTYMGNVAADLKLFMEASGRKWFELAWKDKIAGAFTNSGSFCGDKLNTLQGLVVFAMQHGMIFVGTGTLPAAENPAAMKHLEGPGPEETNRVGASLGPMAVSFQLHPPDAPGPGDLKTAEAYGKRVAEITKTILAGRG